jgi:hypothetical protein
MFWFLSRHVDKIRADKELRALDLNLVTASVAAGGGKETLEQYRGSLLQQRGEIVRTKEDTSSKDDILAMMEM